MSRINTNVSSLIAQTRLSRSNNQLQESLTRLSTGLRINNGKDDPSGLIASEALRSDITATSKAISNNERANQLIATADSALGQISGLLNDIRGLVTESANEGVLSDDQIAANQLQVDSSLEAIDRISQVTSFQGRKVLDGSLAFITDYTAGGSTVRDLQINQANLANGSVAVSVDISAAATQATLTSTVAATGAVAASAVLTFNDTGTVTVTAAATGTAFNGVTIEFVDDNAVTAGQASAVYDDANDTIQVHVNGDTAKAVVASAINALADFNAAAGGGGVGFVEANDAALTATTGSGNNATGGLVADLVLRISGAKGSQVFQFDANATGTSIEAAIDLLADSTGVSATYAGTTLTLNSVGYGSSEFVELEVISEGVGGTFAASVPATPRDEGSDVVATVNGFSTNASGNTISLSTSALNLSLTVTDGSSTDVAFTIDGGGALFQLGPDVVSSQQARIGLAAVNTGKLGGASGRLYELRSGNAKSLANDSTGAANVVDEAIVNINSLRGRLGAFQRTTLETNINSLSDTLSNLSAAESSIRDADFAAESAKLTRAQILVQSGTAVLQIANQNPQNVLALLRG